jgi:hypothetical protein
MDGRPITVRNRAMDLLQYCRMLISCEVNSSRQKKRGKQEDEET